jgi:hypothetical protein
MSNITDILSSAQDGRLIDNLSDRFGLTPEQTDAAVKALVPALSIGLQNAANDPASLEKIIGAVNQPAHHAAFDSPDIAYSDDNVDRGRELLAQLFGSGSEAGQVVQLAARETGLRPGLLSQLLPVLASVVLGGLFKSFNSQGLGGILGQLANSGALGSILGQLTGAPSAPQAGPAAPQGGGGLLGGLLGSLLGGGRGGAGGGAGGGLGGLLGSILGGRRPSVARDTYEPAPNEPAQPGGLDPATLEAALEQIKKTLQPGGGGAANAGHYSELEDVLGKVFGPGKR